MHIRKRLAIASLALLGAGASFAGNQIYFGTSQSKGIYTATFDSDTGALSTPVLAAEAKRVGFVARHPGKPFLYSTADVLGAGGVAAYKIEADETLTVLNRQPGGGWGPCHVSVDSSGQCLMVANYGSGSVASYAIGEDGRLSSPVSIHKHEGSSVNERRQKGAHAHSIYAGPNNRYAYAPDLGIDKVMIYKLDAANGRLTPSGHASVPPGSGPRHMKFGKDGRFAYVLNELLLTVSVFRVLEDGGLKRLTTISTLDDDTERERMSCSEIRVHPNGRFLYAATRDIDKRSRDALTVFGIDGKGGIKRIQVVAAQVNVPRNFNLDPSGKWLLVGGQKSHDVAIFTVNPKTGKMKFTGTKVPFEGGPICIEFLD